MVLIEATRPTRPPLPVLTRGEVDPVTGRDRGVVVTPEPGPAAADARGGRAAAGEQPVARLGETVDADAATTSTAPGATVLLVNARFDIDESLAALPAAERGRPAWSSSSRSPGRRDFPAGIYRRHGAPGHGRASLQPRETNRLAWSLAPEITNLPLTVARDGAGDASFTLDFHAGAARRASGVAAARPAKIAPQTFVAPTDQPRLRRGGRRRPARILARLRIDGIESPIVDRGDHAAGASSTSAVTIT